jgi:hypothetical protein
MTGDFITLQPSERVDNITRDGHELTQLPYPFHVDESGAVLRQDFWQGRVHSVIGFQRKLDRQVIDLLWSEVWADPTLAVNMYVITSDSHGRWSVHTGALKSATKHHEGKHVSNENSTTWTCADEAAARIELGDEQHAEALRQAEQRGVLVNDLPIYHSACRMHQSAAGLSPMGDRLWNGRRFSL